MLFSHQLSCLRGSLVATFSERAPHIAKLQLVCSWSERMHLIIVGVFIGHSVWVRLLWLCPGGLLLRRGNLGNACLDCLMSDRKRRPWTAEVRRIHFGSARRCIQ
jgi:hypothetical protein